MGVGADSELVGIGGAVMPDSDVIVHDDFGYDPASARARRRYLSGCREPGGARAGPAERVPDQRARIRSATTDEGEASLFLASRISASAQAG
jgi:hypothetical protein